MAGALLTVKNADILLVLIDTDKTPTEHFLEAKGKMDEEAKYWSIVSMGIQDQKYTGFFF